MEILNAILEVLGKNGVPNQVVTRQTIEAAIAILNKK